MFLEYGVGSEKDECKWEEIREVMALWNSHVWNGKHFEGFRSNTRCSNLFNLNSNELTLSWPIKVKKVSAPVELANSPTLLYQRSSNGEATESSTRSGDSIYGRNNEYAENQRRQLHVSERKVVPDAIRVTGCCVVLSGEQSDMHPHALMHLINIPYQETRDWCSSISFHCCLVP